MLRFSDLRRLACDHCGAHHTRDVVVGQRCPLCGIGHLQPVEPVPNRARPDDA
jgi:hypothetical protein